MSLFDDRDVFAAMLHVFLAPPPTRAETIIAGWDMVKDRFDYRMGKLTIADDLGAVEPITYELLDYGDKTVVEAEGVVVLTMPRLQC